MCSSDLGIGGQINARWAKVPTVVLLAQDTAGWLNLCDLSSSAYLDAGEMAEPGVAWEQVIARSEGLILLSGGPDGPVDPLFAQGKKTEGASALAAMKAAFGDRFYVVVSGEVSVSREAAELRRLGPGAGFGEIALLRAVPRTASVRAVEPAELLALGRTDFLLAITGTVEALDEANRVAEGYLEADRRAATTRGG